MLHPYKDDTMSGPATIDPVYCFVLITPRIRIRDVIVSYLFWGEGYGIVSWFNV